MKVSKSVGKADTDCKLILLLCIRSSFEFRHWLVCAYDVCCERPWRCPRAWERQTLIASWSFYFASDHHLSAGIDLSTMGCVYYLLMSVVRGHEGFQEHRKDRTWLQVFPLLFLTRAIMIVVSASSHCQVKSYGVARLLRGTQVYKPASHGKVQRSMFSSNSRSAVMSVFYCCDAVAVIFPMPAPMLLPNGELRGYRLSIILCNHECCRNKAIEGALGG